MDFRNWILETFAPVVMIVPSPGPDTLIAKHNGLTMVDALRSYEYFHHLSGAKSQLHRHIFRESKASCPAATPM